MTTDPDRAEPDAADAGDAGAWWLVEEFDQQAREPDGRPNPELLEAVAATASNETLVALFAELADLCADEDPEAAHRYAEHLLALAPLLPDDWPRAVRAVVDVHIAEVCTRTDDQAEARRRAVRCERDLSELLPGLLGDREFVLGCVADAEGRVGDAHAHAARARDLFAERKRWDEAAAAAEAAAQTRPDLTADALDDWRRAAALWVTAERPDEARRCVEYACQWLTQAMAEPGADGNAALPALCATARELALTHDLPVLGARLGLAGAVYETDSDVPWADVEARHERVRDELAALHLDAVEERGELARVDLSQATSALMRGRHEDSERLLASALPALRDAGLDGETQLCEGMLLTVRAALHPDSVDGPLAVDRFTDPDLRAGLLTTDGLRLAAQGRHAEALERLAESAAVTGATPDPDRALMTEAVTGAVRGMAGDRAAAPAALRRVDERLADPALPYAARLALTQVAALLRAVPAGAPPPEPLPQGADLDAAVAEVLDLPVDAPGRGPRAAVLVEAFVRGNPMDDPRRLRPLDGLLKIADGAVPETSQWRRTRTAARLLSLMRALAERDLPDPDLAVRHLDALAAEAGDDPALVPLISAARWSVQVAQSVHHGDATAVGRLSQEVRDFVDGLSSDDPWLRPLQDSMLASLDLLAANERGGDLAASLERARRATETLPDGDLRTSFDDTSALMTLLIALHGDNSIERATDAQLGELQERAEQPGPATTERALAHTVVAAAALRGGRETDLTRVDLALTHLHRARDIAGEDDPHRVFHLTSVSLGLLSRAELTNATADRRQAGMLLEEAQEAAGGPGHPMWQLVNDMLAEVRRTLGATPDSHRTALEGLRGHVWRVLAQPDLSGATVAVRWAATDAVDVARRCLAANDPATAIAALDEGRGLALFAATAVGTLTTRLEAAGDPDLAARWRTAVETGDPMQLPSDLRRAVLRAVTEHGVGGDLLDPPAFDEIQEALRSSDADALVYLVPGAGTMPGYAICAPAHGAPRYVALPDLQVEGVPELDRYLAALRRRDRATRDLARDLALAGAPPASSDPELARSLEHLCPWAWRAAMGPLVEKLVPGLTAVPPGRSPRLVLVPMGDLARVPWHAARRPRDGAYAIELVALSQAASARMLHRSATLGPVPLTGNGLVVGDPDTEVSELDLPAARREALAVQRVFYPGARYLGRRPDGSTSPSGSGSRGEVCAWLRASGLDTGAVLHLACHGFVDAESDPPTAYLQLAGVEDRLFAAELVAMLAEVPDRDLGLVVLAACHTGVAMTGYDEAYSLGTAFLAGGARTVICTQWSVPDAATSAMMFMFHRYLRTEGLPAWAALQQAQRFMLGPDHAFPDDMPKPLRDRLRPDELREVIAWAAFVHWGQ
ncbi:CHAT domain-containing protein [Geodermatophilus sp. SYSU D00710]